MRKKTVHNFINITEGIKISDIEIKSMYRVEKFQEDKRSKPRPLRVTFEDKFDTMKLLKNIANLKEAEDKYKGWTVAANRSTNCTHSSCPLQWGPVLLFFGQAGQVDPLVGWRCCY